MPTTDPAPPASHGISNIIASISSNEAKMLALERRMTGADPGKAPGSGSVLWGTFSQLPGDPGQLSHHPAASGNGVDFATGSRLPQQPASLGAPLGSYMDTRTENTSGIPATAVAVAGTSEEQSNKRRRTDGLSHVFNPIGVVPVTVSPSNSSRPPLSDINPFSGALDAQPGANVATQPMVALPLPLPQPVLNAATGVAMATQEPQQGPQQQHGGATAQASAVALGTASVSGNTNARVRQRKQQSPKHEAMPSVAAASARAAAASTPPWSGTAAAAALGTAGSGPGLGATGAEAALTPRRTRGSAAPVPERGGNCPNQQTTPPSLARHLFDESGPPAGGGGRSNSTVGGNGRSSAPAAMAVAGAAVVPTAPPSAQKRNIMSYYPPVLCASGGAGSGGDHGLTAPLPPSFVLDQNSRDSLPPSLQQRQQQRLEAAGVTAAGDTGEDVGSGAMSATAEVTLQLQQQVTQLQAQVMQVQAAMAAHQSAAGAEIERLKTELQAQSLEAASLRERFRSHDSALQQALAGEAAARAALAALQAASASDAARWSAESAEAARVASEREGRHREEMARLTQYSARCERDLCRSQLSANAARLGSLTLVRTGPMQMAEVWEDGTAFQQLSTRKAALAAAKEEVMAAQKLLRKRLAPPPSGARGSGGGGATAVAVALSGDESHANVVHDMQPYMSGLEFVAADEVYKTRLAVLKREEESLREEEERLNKEKFKQIRSVKLAREEDASRFSRWPVLPDRPGPEGRPRYVLMNLLGKGGFSEVFKAYDLAEARPVCVKIHALASGWSSAKKESYVRHAIREYDIHRSLRHPAVVALLDVLEIDLDTFATVLELCEGGDLDGLLREHRTLPEREARSLMCQIFSGLRYLASRRVIHYDLKPANILFDSRGQSKITDFGLSKQVSEGQTLAGIELTSQGAGTYWYLPPEAFETGGPAPPRISNKLDVWSAGVIFYGMLYGKKPYGEAMSQEQMLRERVMAVPREVDFPSRPAVSSEAKDFIRRCLAWNQDNRPDVEAAASDPYLTGLGMGAASVSTGGAAAGGSGGGGGGGLSLGLAAMVSGGGRR